MKAGWERDTLIDLWQCIKQPLSILFCKADKKTFAPRPQRLLISFFLNRGVVAKTQENEVLIALRDRLMPLVCSDCDITFANIRNLVWKTINHFYTRIENKLVGFQPNRTSLFKIRGHPINDVTLVL